MQPVQLHHIHAQIEQAKVRLQQGIDQDWRTSCMQYPDVLDYYFALVDISFPSERDPAILDPRFGAAKESGGARRAVKERRNSIDMSAKSHRKTDRRRSRGRTPPAAPMPPHHRR